ncbi:serine protease [Alcanivorax sp. S6407]|uniref:serine protease n=1 Tax=Alcanivorax sp. S6407 TaxID=2926424 RepID=UPI001FF468D9|nr:serine protease [Alcanivorax sp. S6407]MCK0155115.1 serine protease [Alcanivorax sp. S6407]
MIRKTGFALASLLVCQPLIANTATPRIVGGEKAAPAWKTLVALISKSRKQQASADPVFQAQFCGGTLLSKDWVLTAAHCVDGMPVHDLEILVGSQTLDIPENSSQLKDAAQVYIHPDYIPPTTRNDIALIRLGEFADPGLSSVGTGVLALDSTDALVSDSPDYDDILAALGWGVITYSEDDTPQYPTELQEVALDFVPNPICQNLYNLAGGGTIFSSMICANEPDPDPVEQDPFGEDSCQGDSGGPLFFGTTPSNDHPQVGITSFGGTCGDAEVPGGYSRVSSFLGWIEQVSSIQRPLRDLTIPEDTLHYQGVSTIPFAVTITNNGNSAATGFAITIEHSKSLTLTELEDDLSCATEGSTKLSCFYSGDAIPGNSSKALAFSALDDLSRETGSETLTVEVTLDEYRDYHRLNDSGQVSLFFGYPTVSIAAEPFCLNPGDSSVQMRVEATLSNSSMTIHSEGSVVTGTLPESLTLLGKASPNCSVDELNQFTCTVGQLEADTELSAVIAVTAASDTQESLQVAVENDNGFTVGSTLSTTVALDFSREDLPTCPTIPSPSTSLVSSSSGGGSLPMALLGLMTLLGLRRKD